MAVTNAATCRGGAIVYCFDTPVPFLKTVHLDQLFPVKTGQRIMETSECLVRQPLPENDQGMIRCLVMSRETLLTKYEMEKKYLDDDAQDEIRWCKKGQQWTQELDLKATASVTVLQANPLPQNPNPPHTLDDVLPAGSATKATQNNTVLHPGGSINAHPASHPEPSASGISMIVSSAINGHVSDTEVEPSSGESLRSPTKRKNVAASPKSPKRKYKAPDTPYKTPAKRGRPKKAAVRSAPSKLPVTQKVNNPPSGVQIPSASENSGAEETWRQMDIKSLIIAEPTFDRAVRKGLEELFTEEELQSASKKLASKNQKNALDGFRSYFLTDLLMNTRNGLMYPKMNRTEIQNQILDQVLKFSVN